MKKLFKVLCISVVLVLGFVSQSFAQPMGKLYTCTYSYLIGSGAQAVRYPFSDTSTISGSKACVGAKSQCQYAQWKYELSRNINAIPASQCGFTSGTQEDRPWHPIDRASCSFGLYAYKTSKAKEAGVPGVLIDEFDGDANWGVFHSCEDAEAQCESSKKSPGRGIQPGKNYNDVCTGLTVCDCQKTRLIQLPNMPPRTDLSRKEQFCTYAYYTQSGLNLTAHPVRVSSRDGQGVACAQAKRACESELSRYQRFQSYRDPAALPWCGLVSK
jgi:predicted enzyme related to lactoylglutathione lyase